MKTIFTVTLFIVFLTNVIYTQDDRWVLIGISETYTLYYDSETINYDSKYDVYEVWIKDVPKFPKIDNEGYMLEYQLSRWKLYCKGGKIQVLRSIAYLNDGQTQTNDSPKEIKEYVPGSMGEIIYLTICKLSK